MMKALLIFVFILIGGITLLASCVGSSSKQKSLQKTIFINDSATSDTPVETLKTLTAEISTVEQQNKKLAEQNQSLIAQDKSSLSQFKTDVMTQVQQQIDHLKSDQVQPLGLPAHDESETKNTPKFDEKGNPISADKGFIWVTDLQQSNSIDTKNQSKDKTSNELAALLNPNLDKKKEQLNANGSDKNIETIINSGLSNGETKAKLKTIPYYTIPVNATLTGAIAMQPLIGRVPIDGKVPDPYSFKAIIGPKNLAANGIDIPTDIQGIVTSGIAEGDMLGGCVRGVITSMTFIFADGRISTTQAKSGEGLGTIAAANGNPCIVGSFHSDDAIFLGATATLAGFQGYGNALSQSQLSTTASSTTGASISTLIGSANKYAFGQGFSASAQAAQQWWNQRVQNSFDFVYVPNVDPQTGKKLELNINITQEIPIDYNPRGRKVFYDHSNNPYTTKTLD